MEGLDQTSHDDIDQPVLYDYDLGYILTSSRRGQPFRFQNKAYVNGVTGPLLITPYILVLPVGAPTIQEIQ
jgi:hypothetical protein